MTPPDVVLLAGGASRRMGSDKATLVVEGRRLVDVMVDRMTPVAGTVLVASGPRSLGCAHEVADAADCRGPLAGIVGALRASRAPHLAIVPVDAPDTRPDVVTRLVDLCIEHGRAAAVVVADGHLQALHAVIAAEARPAVEDRVAAGEGSPRRLLAWLDALRVDVDGWGHLDPAGRMARDWDQPRDLPDGVHPA